MLAPTVRGERAPSRVQRASDRVAEFREFQDGELIAGTRYRVLRLIGVGGMGTVYEVEHTELGKRFVLKALLRELSRREDLVIRLRNEWRALGRLEHPNIVTVTDAGTSANGVPYYVMERLEGETLAQRMRKTRRFPVRDAVDIAIGMLEGLAAAHQIGVVHRDVKPPNIFLLSDGRPKVLDFGVAKIADDPGVVTARGVAVGTPRYMSPEQARGEAVDGRADVYSTGLILFETISGVSPFDDARDANELILAHLAKVPPPLSSLSMGVPSVLDAMVASMLAKSRSDRPDTALEAARRLRELLPALAEVKPSLPPVVEHVPPSVAGRVHDTTRPDGVALRSTGTATSQSAAGSLSWLERPTLPRSLLNSESSSASLNGPWARVSADTLVGLPPTTNPDAATPFDSNSRVSTEMLTAVPSPEAAVTRTRFPAATRASETPPPVAPAEISVPATTHAGKSRRWLWLASAGACVAAAAALFAAKLSSNDVATASPQHSPSRERSSSVAPVTAGAPVVAAAAAPPQGQHPAETSAPTQARGRLTSSDTESAAPASPASKARASAASPRRESRPRATAGPSVDQASASTAPPSAPAPAKKKPAESALPGSGL
jgi:serine/threonine-protein kinase